MSCDAVRLRNSVSPNFVKIAAHLTHSLTLQELRHNFDKNAPVDNGIPTINPNLNGEPRILPNAPDFPLYNSFNIFKHLALDALDSVLSHMDDPNWGWRNAPILEHVFHEYHMLSLYTEVAKTYKKMSKGKGNRNKPVKATKLCECLAEENSMIHQTLEFIDKLMQG